MFIAGGFTLVYPGYEIFMPNRITVNGCLQLSRTFWQASGASPATLYLGLTNSNPAEPIDLADVTPGEPVGHGYARQALVRNNTDWTVTAVGNAVRSRSKNVAFTASTDWDKAWTRMFLASAVSGSSGDVLAISGPLNEANIVLSGAPPTVHYDFWMRP